MPRSKWDKEYRCADLSFKADIKDIYKDVKLSFFLLKVFIKVLLNIKQKHCFYELLNPIFLKLLSHGQCKGI